MHLSTILHAKFDGNLQATFKVIVKQVKSWLIFMNTVYKPFIKLLKKIIINFDSSRNCNNDHPSQIFHTEYRTGWAKKWAFLNTL